MGAGSSCGLVSGRGEAVSGFPRLRVKSLEEGGKPASVGFRPSSSILSTELSECQGKLQELHRLLQSLESLHRIPSAPVIPTHQVRSRRRQGSLPSCHVNLHHLPRQVPCPPYMLPFPGEPPSPRCPSPPYPDRLRPVSLPLWSDPFPLCPGSCQAVRLLPPPPWPSASHLALGVFPTLRLKLTHLDLPGLGDDRETQEGEADQPHVVHTELCQGRHHRAGEVAPETLGGRRRRRLGPSTLPLHPQVGRLHGSVPNLSRYLESRDPSGPRGLPPPDYAHLQRSFWALAQKGECELEGQRGAGGGRARGRKGV